MIWNNDFETLPREAIESLQLKRLQQTVEKVYATVPFYRSSFDKVGIKRLVISTYQAVSGTGAKAIEELEQIKNQINQETGEGVSRKAITKEDFLNSNLVKVDGFKKYEYGF